MKINNFKKIAIEAAKEAGKMLMKNFNKATVIKYKDRQDVLTDADLRAEKIIINKIKSNFPDHNIISEEKGEENLKSEYTWIIDPLDGTKHYIRKIPIFCVSIALQKKEEIIVGVVFFPAMNNLFYAEKGKGAFLNDKKIHVSRIKNLANSFIYTELPNYKLSKKAFSRNHKKLEKLFKKTYRVRAWGSGPLGLCYVASGGFESYIALNDGAKLWDIAAGAIIVKEAGGKVTNINGNKFIKKTIHLIASNDKVHDKLLKLLI
ncbi:MAG: inositol monophosphatase family protein [Candidatus Nealsonbacteria bacterium]|nr:inositol monophosphatase family protein [Candidatus Nealsonbacteria bacterium]